MKKIYVIFLVLITVSISCTKNFDDFNTDKKNPTDVEGEFLFSNGQKQLMDQISNTNVNRNIWKLISQYWTETTYTDESNYDIVNRTIPDNIFNRYYRRTLKSFADSRALIAEDVLAATEIEATRTNKLNILDLHVIYAYHNLVNMFGNVPYSEALNIENVSPAYDDAATITNDLLTQLDNIIATMVSKDAIDSAAAYDKKAYDYSYAGADVVYGGDPDQWLKFANSLKLKIGIMLADVNPILAQSTVESAVASGVFESNADDALFAYLGSSPNANQLYEDLVVSGRSDFVPANTIIDIMLGLNDPRLPYYFDNLIDTTSDDIDNPTYVGGAYGYSNAFPNCSHINAKIQEPSFPGILLTYSEVQFYIAEAAARGWDVGQTAEAAYDEAVTASILFWGGTETEATDYLAADGAFDAGNWEESIATQSYISFYTRGMVAYNQYRRFDLPVMNEAPDAVTEGPVPTRFTYPINEQTLNADNYYSASDAIGGDDLLTKLFWDTK